jgi:hypothetical protein
MTNRFNRFIPASGEPDMILDSKPEYAFSCYSGMAYADFFPFQSVDAVTEYDKPSPFAWPSSIHSSEQPGIFEVNTAL